MYRTLDRCLFENQNDAKEHELKQNFLADLNEITKQGKDFNFVIGRIKVEELFNKRDEYLKLLKKYTYSLDEKK